MTYLLECVHKIFIETRPHSNVVLMLVSCCPAMHIAKLHAQGRLSFMLR